MKAEPVTGDANQEGVGSKLTEGEVENEKKRSALPEPKVSRKERKLVKSIAELVEHMVVNTDATSRLGLTLKSESELLKQLHEDNAAL